MRIFKKIITMFIIMAFVVSMESVNIIIVPEIAEAETVSTNKTERVYTDQELFKKELITQRQKKAKVEKKRLEKIKKQKQKEKERKRKAKRKRARKRFKKNLWLLSHLVYSEDGAGSWKGMCYVASVAMNRVASPLYPNTLEEVIFEYSQYEVVQNGRFYMQPSKEAIAAARWILKRGSILPSETLFQANFSQGSSVYAIVDNMFFCNY